MTACVLQNTSPLRPSTSKPKPQTPQNIVQQWGRELSPAPKSQSKPSTPNPKRQTPQDTVQQWGGRELSPAPKLQSKTSTPNPKRHKTLSSSGGVENSRLLQNYSPLRIHACSHLSRKSRRALGGNRVRHVAVDSVGVRDGAPHCAIGGYEPTVKKMDLRRSPRGGLRNLNAMCPDWGTSGARVRRAHKSTGTSPRRLGKEETMYGSMGERGGAHVRMSRGRGSLTERIPSRTVPGE
jgi:hypothetical protein